MTPPVRALPPGHFLVARPDGPVDVFRYWRASLRPAKSPSPETPEKILEVLRDSVAVHMRADVPVGAFLSGGIDSAAICALAAQIRPGMMTFTVGFDREDYSEIEYATETADALGVKSVPYVITASEFAARLPEIVWHLDDPLADAAAIPLWFAAREARKHVQIVLSGEGADELFGGYGVYYQPGVVRAGQSLPAGMRAPIVGAASRLPAGVRGKGLLHRISTPLRERYVGNARIFDDDQVDRLVRFGDGYASDVAAPIFDQAEEMGLDDVSTMQLVDINTWLPGDILVKADRVSAAHGLQLRSPYLDREVMAVAARLARAEKTAAGTTKFALREAVGGLLPREATERPKFGFPVPLGEWLTRELGGFAEQILVEAHTDEWLNKRAVLAEWQRFQSGDPLVQWRQVWTLLVFSLWHQIYVEKLYDPESLGWQGA
jgi:asparagine synthase (glutamine-hydrolysing)